ncbi:hypothetical protein K2P97_09765 [bacterium]|nr:hypothetical protein [bacterium]
MKMELKQISTIAVILITVELLFTACTTNPNKAKDIETKMENTAEVGGDTSLGVKDGYMVVQKKVMMNEELRKLQYDVYELEDRVYGNRKYGSLGLYGVLRECRLQLSDTKNGGDGKLKWTEPIDRVTEKEEEFKIGLDEEKKLVGVSEEFLADRIKRFKGYKTVLDKRQDEYEEKVAICKAELKSKQN